MNESFGNTMQAFRFLSMPSITVATKFWEKTRNKIESKTQKTMRERWCWLTIEQHTNKEEAITLNHNANKRQQNCKHLAKSNSYTHANTRDDHFYIVAQPIHTERHFSAQNSIQSAECTHSSFSCSLGALRLSFTFAVLRHNRRKTFLSLPERRIGSKN